MISEESKLTRLENLRQSNMETYGYGPNAMRGIRICAECGAPSPAEKKVCGLCGTKLPRETLFQQYKKRHRCCPHCETVVADSAQFCPECGTRIRMVRPLHIFR